MNQEKKKLLIIALAFFVIFMIVASGCTGLNSIQFGNAPANTATLSPADTTQMINKESAQSENIKPAISWSDIYPDCDQLTKAKLIEKAKDEITDVFPNVDRTTLKGNWVEHSRLDYNHNEEIGRPYIIFEKAKALFAKIPDKIEVKIKVDPQSGEIIYFAPYGVGYQYYRQNPKPQISLEEAEKNAINLIKNIQGENSIVYNPDVSYYKLNAYEPEDIPVLYMELFDSYNGVQYENSKVFIAYDTARDEVQSYSDKSTDPKLLYGLTTLSPEPEITLEEAKQIFKDKISEKYNIDDLGLEFSEVWTHDSYLLWWDPDEYVYADDPKPLSLVWYIACSDKESREVHEKTGDTPKIGVLRIDAHTGEIYRLVYGDIWIQTFGYMPGE
ncbi:hypothetical protein F1737_05935 [Methanoplanus sp. FWC-SCC4]|uniref:Uncharacterized protein n=1 Tax=Methanochimaera problematica TaxID=2609417 RepID=A0AA97FC78_9EURY|nr:hypothetical protein [Methanoplanus sp. FWC-SCC4]WOF16284.1 hypothetical protein F1737_05935 [Methanoplanus sp. FWC-SCC4]